MPVLYCLGISKAKTLQQVAVHGHTFESKQGELGHKPQNHL